MQPRRSQPFKAQTEDEKPMTSGKANRPCGTPGAVYETVLDPKSVTLRILLPAPVIDGLSLDERGALIQSLHDAIIPTVEKLYKQVWSKHFANRLYPDHDRPFPARHAQLFSGAR